MPSKFFVSFNSPQCGWMSIGFRGNGAEFHTTTASAPHEKALAELLEILASLLDKKSAQNDFLLKWNRDPEEFDFVFARKVESVRLEVFQYPTEERVAKEREKVFEFEGAIEEVARAFHFTLAQMKEDVDTDAFEQNWHQKFPTKEYTHFESALKNYPQ